jgi:glycosyltransferase involved in cell wall biosynthesis
MADSMLPTVSIIIPAHNEAHHLHECLTSLSQQNYPSFEILLVDNASTDHTHEICAHFPNVKYIYFDRRKSSYASRNEGVRQSSSEIIAFFDADQTAEPNYLRLLLEQYVENDPYHVYQGRLADDPRVPRVLREFLSYSADDFSARETAPWRVSTAAVAIPRVLFEDLGGFNEQVLSCGDLEFFGRAQRRAMLHRCMEVGGYHYWASSVRQQLLREERFGFGNCLRCTAEGRSTPSFARELLRVGVLASIKLTAAAAVPLRYQRCEWRIRWYAQMIHVLAKIYWLRGLIKYKLGHNRAGDLPIDANASTRIA